MARITTSGGKTVGDIVRYVPAPEPAHAAWGILVLTLVELAFVGLFFYAMFWGTNAVEFQTFAALTLGGATLTLAGILSLYRKFFVPDVLQVKLRKLKYEDLR